jgi:hypothetical protein
MGHHTACGRVRKHGPGSAGRFQDGTLFAYDSDIAGLILGHGYARTIPLVMLDEQIQRGRGGADLRHS